MKYTFTLTIEGEDEENCLENLKLAIDDLYESMDRPEFDPVLFGQWYIVEN